MTLTNYEPADGYIKSKVIPAKLYSEGHTFFIEDYYWSRKTYERQLKIAGFHDIAWRPMQVSDEGLTEFGKEYWHEFLDNPGIIVLEARK